MKYTEINIKQDMPLVADAMRYLQDSIVRLKRDKYECVLIVHGYGSTGKGGAIRDKARQWLNAQKREGKIKHVINGEDLDIFNLDALDLKARHRELAAYFKVCNHGVTVIEI